MPVTHESLLQASNATATELGNNIFEHITHPEEKRARDERHIGRTLTEYIAAPNLSILYTPANNYRQIRDFRNLKLNQFQAKTKNPDLQEEAARLDELADKAPLSQTAAASASTNRLLGGFKRNLQGFLQQTEKYSGDPDTLRKQAAILRGRAEIARARAAVSLERKTTLLTEIQERKDKIAGLETEIFQAQADVYKYREKISRFKEQAAATLGNLDNELTSIRDTDLAIDDAAVRKAIILLTNPQSSNKTEVASAIKTLEKRVAETTAKHLAGLKEKHGPTIEQLRADIGEREKELATITTKLDDLAEQENNLLEQAAALNETKQTKIDSITADVHRHAKLMLSLAVMKYITERSKIENEYRRKRIDQGAYDEKLKGLAANLQGSVYFYLQLVRKKPQEDQPQEFSTELTADEQKEIEAILMDVINTVEADKKRATIWLIGALAAGGIFGASTAFSTPVHQSHSEPAPEEPTNPEAPPPYDDVPPSYDEDTPPPYTEEPIDDAIVGDLNLTEDQAWILSIVCICASITSNFAIYGNATEEILRLYLKNMKELLCCWREGPLHNADGKIVYLTAEEKVLVILKTLGYSISMIALLVSAFIGALNPAAALVGLLIVFSIMVSGRFNNDYYVNEVGGKIGDKLKGLLSGDLKETLLSLVYTLAFSGASFIAFNVGYTMFCKILIMGPLSMAALTGGAALLPFLLTVLPLVLAIGIMHIKVQPGWQTYLKYALVTALISLSITAAIALAISPLGAAALIVLAATFVGVMSAIVIFKMLSNAIVQLPNTYRDFMITMKDQSLLTKILTGIVVLTLVLGLVAFNAFAQTFISTNGLEEAAVYTLVDGATIMFISNAINSAVLGARSWILLMTRFLPGMYDSIAFSDYMRSWDEILTHGSWTDHTKFYAATILTFAIAALPTFTYSIVRAYETIASGIISITLDFLNWMATPTERKKDTTDGEHKMRAAAVNVGKTIAFLTVGIPLIAVSIGFGIVYMFTRLVSYGIGKIYKKEADAPSAASSPGSHSRKSSAGDLLDSQGGGASSSRAILTAAASSPDLTPTPKPFWKATAEGFTKFSNAGNAPAPTEILDTMMSKMALLAPPPADIPMATFR